MEDVNLGIQNMAHKPVSPPALGKPDNPKQTEDSDELDFVDCDQYLATDMNTEKEMDMGEYSYIESRPESQPVSPPAPGKQDNPKQTEDSDELDCDQYLVTDANTDKEMDMGEYSYAEAHPECRYLYENV